MTQSLIATIDDTVVTSSIHTTKQQRRAPRAACLVELSGLELGRRIPLENARGLILGRSPQCDFHLEDESVSRRHARFVRHGREVHVTDLGSTNGTYVNDELVTHTRLRDGDTIRLGRTLFKYVTSANVEAEYHEEIYRLMTTDGLTGAFNKRYFEELLEKETLRCHRYERTFSLALLDIDHFKHINDTYGHLAGDAVLKRLGALLRAHVRRTDAVARLGGEEFGLLLPEVRAVGAVAFAEKIRRVVDHASFRFRGQPLSITVSLGIAEWQPDFNDPEDIVKAADTKLYAAKQAGRNRVMG